MKRLFQTVVVALAALTLTACGSKKEEVKENNKLNVVTTFYPMYDFAKQIVGDKGNVTVLIDGATEPHDYEPSAKDIAKIQDADIFIYNSTDMETWVPTALESMGDTKTKIIEAGGVAEAEQASDNGATDPHVWLDPVLAQDAVLTISEAIVKTYPELQEDIEKNTNEYVLKLKELDSKYASAFKDAKNRTFVTQHEAFGHLAKRYNLIQKPIAGLNPDQEPNPSELAEIQDFVKNNNVKVIFTEGLSSSKIAKTIADNTGAELRDLNTLEGLTNQEQSEGEDYLSVMEKNLNALKDVIK